MTCFQVFRSLSDDFSCKLTSIFLDQQTLFDQDQDLTNLPVK